MNYRLAVTMGDPGGIGPEVLLKAFKEITPLVSFLVIGTPEPFRRLGLPLPWRSSKYQDRIKFLDVSERTKAHMLAHRGKAVRQLLPGAVSLYNAAAAYASLEAAVDLARLGKVQGIVTAPVNKTAMRLMERDFYGHTEYLAREAGVKTYAMMFASPRLIVTLCTIHVPLRKVSSLITRKRVLEKIQLTLATLKKHFSLRRPRLAVCALNPHGRETGFEDEKEIRPAVEAARRSGILAIGPLSADQLFHDAYERRYDAVISMYHDQGLAPFKMVSFRDGVNVTLGLPYIRTSPDHGTAYDIAYRNTAQGQSMYAAINLAVSMILGRKPF